MTEPDARDDEEISAADMLRPYAHALDACKAENDELRAALSRTEHELSDLIARGFEEARIAERAIDAERDELRALVFLLGTALEAAESFRTRLFVLTGQEPLPESSALSAFHHYVEKEPD